MSFDNLIGNENIKRILNDSVSKNNILHSYLFYGTDGIGKKLFATQFAKMILCFSNDSKPCNECKSCIEFDSDNHPDFFLIEPEQNSLKIDQIRNMQKNIIEKPIVGNKKVYIINDADKMTKEAQNCLLKTLEEPQEFVVMILVCSNENYILPTVKSRCTQIFFNNLEDKEIKNFIAEKNNSGTFDENMLELSGGSLKKAISISEKSEILEKLETIINSLEYTNELSFILNNEFFSTNKEDINLLLDYTYVLLFKHINSSNRMACIKAMSVVEHTKKKLMQSNNFDMTIDNMLIKIWEAFNEKYNRG